MNMKFNDGYVIAKVTDTYFTEGVKYPYYIDNENIDGMLTIKMPKDMLLDICDDDANFYVHRADWDEMVQKVGGNDGYIVPKKTGQYFTEDVRYPYSINDETGNITIATDVGNFLFQRIADVLNMEQ